MGAAPQALPLLDRLVKEFEKSQYLARAEKLMAGIKDGTAADAIAREVEKQTAKAKKAQDDAMKKQEKKKGPISS